MVKQKIESHLLENKKSSNASAKLVHKVSPLEPVKENSEIATENI